MLDVVLIAAVIAFFVATDLFVGGCRRIVDRDRDDRPGEQT